MQQRSEETRLNLFEAANRLFAQNGYDATGVAEICAEAGVSKGAFYHHFPTKQAIFLEIMNSWLGGLETAFSQMALNTQDLPQALLLMAEITGHAFQYADIRQSILPEFWMQARRDPTIWQAAIAPYQRYLDFFTSLIQQGIDQGTLRLVDPKQASRTLVAVAVGLLMQGILYPQATDWGADARQSIQFLLDGLSRREA